MTHPARAEGGRIAAERFKESAFNKPINAPRDSARANHRARAKMSLLELQCGITPEQYEQIHAEQRARVRKRWLAA